MKPGGVAIGRPRTGFGPPPHNVTLSHYYARVTYDDDRVVEFDEEVLVLPDQSTDDTDRGWGVPATSNDERLLEERPPHWD